MLEHTRAKLRRGFTEAERPGAITADIVPLFVGEAEVNVTAIADMIRRRFGSETGAKPKAACRLARDFARDKCRVGGFEGSAGMDDAPPAFFPPPTTMRFASPSRSSERMSA